MKALEELGQVDRAGRAGEFVSFAHHLARGRGNLANAANIAVGGRAPQRVASVLKAAVTATDWGGELVDYRLMVNAFTDILRHNSIFYRLVADGAVIRLPFQVRVGTIVTAAGAGVVEPGEAVAMHSMALSDTTLERKKAAALVALTDELLDAGGSAAEALISRSLRAGVGEAVDTEFLNIVMTGVSPSASTTNALADLETLLEAVAPTEQSRLYWLASPSVARRAALVAATGSARLFPETSPTGGTLLGIPMLVSSQVATGRLILIDASSIGAAADTIDIDISTHAAVQLDSEPTMSVGQSGSPSAPSAANAVSLWQTNSVAIRSIAYFGAAVLRTPAAAAIDGMAWGEGSP